MRPIYSAKLDYPREVSSRSATYEPVDGQALSQAAGFIPEVRQTYAYWEAIYGYMNEHGLSLGESTAAANFPVSRTNLIALMWIRPLTAIAMERCKTALCAVETMGSLAEEYGFYGEDPGASGAGECLIIADAREVWVFEITGDTTGKSAFWAAKRVTEGHVVLIANNFILRDVDCSNRESVRCSTDLPAKAHAAGAWTGFGVLDWSVSMGPDIQYFSYTPGYPPIPEYTTARLWRVFSRVAPSLKLQRTDNAFTLPFSVKAEWKISARALMDLMRDHFEGTDIDLTVGAFAGPFGNPNRLEGGVGLKVNGGQFARAISLPRTSYATLGQSFGDAPAVAVHKLWWASDTPASSVFVPFYANTSAYAETYRTGDMSKYDERSAWWVFNFVANFMNINYRLMRVDVEAKIGELQDNIDSEMQAVELAAALGGAEKAVVRLERFQVDVQNSVVDSWRSFGRFLIMKYNDGQVNYPIIAGQHYGYPAWWLQMFGLDDDIRPKWGKPSATPPSLFTSLGPGPFEVIQASPLGAAAGVGQLWAVAGYAFVFLAGTMLGRRTRAPAERSSDYHVMGEE